MTTMASQITSLTAVYSTVYSDADQRKHQGSASLAFVWGIHRSAGNSPGTGEFPAQMASYAENVSICPTLSSQVAPQIVVMTTCGATNDGKVGMNN